MSFIVDLYFWPFIFSLLLLQADWGVTDHLAWSTSYYSSTLIPLSSFVKSTLKQCWKMCYIVWTTYGSFGLRWYDFLVFGWNVHSRDNLTWAVGQNDSLGTAANGQSIVRVNPVVKRHISQALFCMSFPTFQMLNMVLPAFFRKKEPCALV